VSGCHNLSVFVEFSSNSHPNSGRLSRLIARQEAISAPKKPAGRSRPIVGDALDSTVLSFLGAACADSTV
jgi:hypothetical protein